MPRRIPVFSQEGLNLGTRLPETIDGLAVSGLVALERNKKGFVVAAHMRGKGGSNPLSNRPSGGTRYSYATNVGTKGRVWQLSRIGGGRRMAPDELRGDFLAVTRSITTSPPTKP